VTYGDFIGFGEGSLAQLNRKLVTLNKAQLARWDAVKDRVMESAAHAKYIQNIDSRWAKMLRSTKNAELWHLQRQRAKPSALIRFEHLEKLRIL
jgi:hypothetical protein